MDNIVNAFSSLNVQETNNNSIDPINSNGPIDADMDILINTMDNMNIVVYSREELKEKNAKYYEILMDITRGLCYYNYNFIKSLSNHIDFSYEYYVAFINHYIGIPEFKKSSEYSTIKKILSMINTLKKNNYDIYNDNDLTYMSEVLDILCHMINFDTRK